MEDTRKRALEALKAIAKDDLDFHFLKRAVFDELQEGYYKEDILSHCGDDGLTEDDAVVIAERIADDFDCDLSYWQNIENTVEDYLREKEDER